MGATAAATPAATAADPCAAAAMTRKPGARDGRAVSPAIVLGDDLDVQMILASLDVAVLDPAIREVHLVSKNGRS
jgi:hypothetical protein